MARIGAKGRMTIPKKVREAARLVEGEVVVLWVDNEQITLRKAASGEDAYLRAAQQTREWQSREDEDAWRDL